MVLTNERTDNSYTVKLNLNNQIKLDIVMLSFIVSFLEKWKTFVTENGSMD